MKSRPLEQVCKSVKNCFAMDGACLTFVSAPPLTTCSCYRVTQGAKIVKWVTFSTALTEQCVKSDKTYPLWSEWVKRKRKVFYTAEIPVFARNKYNKTFREMMF